MDGWMDGWIDSRERDADLYWFKSVIELVIQKYCAITLTCYIFTKSTLTIFSTISTPIKYIMSCDTKMYSVKTWCTNINHTKK